MGNSSSSSNSKADVANATMRICDGTNKREKLQSAGGRCVLIRDKVNGVETCRPMRVMTPTSRSMMGIIDAHGTTYVFPGDTLVELTDDCMCHQIDTMLSLK